MEPQGVSCLYPPISWITSHAARLSFYVDAGDETQFVMFGWQVLSPLSHSLAFRIVFIQEF